MYTSNLQLYIHVHFHFKFLLLACIFTYSIVYYTIFHNFTDGIQITSSTAKKKGYEKYKKASSTLKEKFESVLQSSLKHEESSCKEHCQYNKE